MFLRRFLLFCVALIYTINSIAADEYKIVKTKNGKVRGVWKTSLLKNIPFYAFKGIPYAKPPIGDLRFKAPEPIDSWKSNVLDAFEYGDMCIQPGTLMPNPYSQNEDCLKINIFVPADVKPDEKLAVLFFIHGGGYIDGSSHDSLYGPDFIIEKETILVTFNYRLGPLGFLSLDQPEYSGNMGLKDQQLALKWISENIEQFGGDKKRITIFGHSAGGASTNFHILSAESRKYFRNAIPMSGSVFNYWALSQEKHQLVQAHKMAEELDEPKKSFEELIEFLKTVPAEEFNKIAVIKAGGGARYNAPQFSPIVEREDAKRPFMVKSPEKLYETSKIDVDAMFTVTSLEALSLVSKTPATFLKMLDANFNLPLPFTGLNLPLESKEHHNLTDEIRNFYFGDDAIDEQAIPQFFEYLSDLNFVLGIDKSVKSQAAHSTTKTYYLWFSVDSTLNIFKKLDLLTRSEILILPGAAHADDLCYLFRCGFAEPYYNDIINNPNDEQSKISFQTIDYITKLFTNFAKYGEPSYQNDPIDGFKPIQLNDVDSGIHFLDINNDGLTIGLRPHEKVINFWTSIEKRAFQFAANKQSAQNRDEF